MGNTPVQFIYPLVALRHHGSVDLDRRPIPASVNDLVPRVLAERGVRACSSV